MSDTLWKSVIGATGSPFGCERATFYREVIRDPATGRRLDVPASEAVLFGIAVDAAHALIVGERMQHGPVDMSTVGVDISDEGTGEPVLEDMVRDLCERATRHGVERARARPAAEPWTDESTDVFTTRVGLAVEKLLGLWPNRMTEKGNVLPEPEGAPPGPPIGWTDPAPGLYIEGQRRLESPTVVGGRGISGKPDYVYTGGGVIVGWLDVKALSRPGRYPHKWTAGEAAAYDHMVAVENGGVLPEWHAYLEYVRVQKPYWHMMVAPVSPAAMWLAGAYFARWTRALDGNDPDAMAFQPSACLGCEWREPLPGHDGCAIGAAVADIFGVDQSTPDDGY